MIDEIVDFLAFVAEMLFGGALVLIVAFALVAGFAWAIGAVDYHNKLMADCMADGHKRYECVGILQGRR